jgi:hypothetical protein
MMSIKQNMCPFSAFFVGFVETHHKTRLPTLSNGNLRDFAVDSLIFRVRSRLDSFERLLLWL